MMELQEQRQQQQNVTTNDGVALSVDVSEATAETGAEEGQQQHKQ